MPSLSCHINMSAKPASAILDIMELGRSCRSCTAVRRRERLVDCRGSRQDVTTTRERDAVSNTVSSRRLADSQCCCGGDRDGKKTSRCGVLASGSTACSNVTPSKAGQPSSGPDQLTRTCPGGTGGSDPDSSRVASRDCSNGLVSADDSVTSQADDTCNSSRTRRDALSKYTSAKQTMAALRDLLQLGSIHGSW